MWLALKKKKEKKIKSIAAELFPWQKRLFQACSQQEPCAALKELVEALGRKKTGPLLTNDCPQITKHSILSNKQRALEYQSALKGVHISPKNTSVLLRTE